MDSDDRPVESLDADASAAPRGAVGYRRHAEVADLDRADTVIDARSPAEYALDHIPGAINCPVLSDDERRIVGTLYKQQGAFEARRVGGAMVAANLARHLETTFADKPARWKPIVYCWRGGLRSGSMVQWLRLVGWDARQLGSGYKHYRRHVIDTIDAIAPRLPLRVLCGPTGSAKTRILHALAALGEQTLDLEACADHKGSVLGGLPDVEQPSQKAFETRLAAALRSFDLQRPVYVEAESRKIGRVALPTPLVERLRASPCIEIVASTDARLDYLLDDYAYLGDDPDALAAKLAQLHGLQSNETLVRWQGWAHERALRPLFRELMTLHYDPAYARSQGGNYLRLADAVRVEVDRLDADAMGPIAARIAALATDSLLAADRLRHSDGPRTEENRMTYVDGFVVPCPKAKLDAYLEMSNRFGKIWREYGALQFRECVGDDVKPGKFTSFPQSVKLEDDEVVVFSWIVFESREARDRISAAVMKDPRLAEMMDPANVPFDGKRMIYGGFEMRVDL